MRLGRVNDRRLEHLAGGIDHRQLAAGAIAGVVPHDHLAADRRLHQESAQILRKHADGAVRRGVKQVGADLALDGGRDQALVGVSDRLAQKRRRLALAAGDDLALEIGIDRLLRHAHRHTQKTLALAAGNREIAVRADAGERLGIVVILRVDRVLLLCRAARQFAEAHAALADGFSVLCALCDLLGNNVTRARQRSGSVRHLLFRGNEVRRRIRERLVVPLLTGEDQERERFQSPLTRDRRAGLALLLIGEVHILQFIQRLCLVERRRYGGGQFALRVDGGADLLAARVKAAQIVQPLDQCAQLHVVEAAGRLLAIARDERDRVPVVVQLDRLLDLPALDPEFIGQNLQNIHVSFPFPQVF